MINSHFIDHSGFAQTLSGSPEVLSTEATGYSQLSPDQHSRFGGSSLGERKVECLEHSESVRRYAQGDTNDTDSILWWYRYPEEPFGERDAIYRWIAKGANDKIEELIDQGCNLNHSDNGDEPPLFYALNFGSLETVLLLLKHGADPNLFQVRFSCRFKFNGDYSLRETDKLSRLVLLLSYGANLWDDHQAFGDVFEDNRISRLAVYYFWEKYCESHAGPIRRPESVAELNQLVFELPVLQIMAYISLFNDQPEMLYRPSGNLPANLRDFFEFIGA